MSKQIKRRHTASVPMAVVIGTLCSLLTTIIGMMIAAQLINTSAISEDTLAVICPGIWFLSSFVGSIVTTALASKQILLASSVSSVAYLGVLFVIAAMFLEGNYGKIGWGILSVILGMVPAVFIYLKKSSPSKSKFKLRRL